MTKAPNTSVDLGQVGETIRQAKILARRYRDLTGKPLGITSEVVEYEAARIMGLQLAKVGQRGYDATRGQGSSTRKLQIKTRCVQDTTKSQRVPAIKLEKEWDSVLLVLLDADFEPMEIYEAERFAIKRALEKPGSKARNGRGQLGVAKFKSIGKCVWQKPPNLTLCPM